MLSMLMHRDAEGTVMDHGTLHSLDVVYVQWTHLHSAMVPDKLPKQSSIAETLEQLTLCKCKGRPHWGKNHERVFRHPDCKLVESFPAANVAALLEMQRQHDPAKVFEPELFGQLLQKAGPEYSDLCTAHFWCYCEVGRMRVGLLRASQSTRFANWLRRPLVTSKMTHIPYQTMTTYGVF